MNMMITMMMNLFTGTAKKTLLITIGITIFLTVLIAGYFYIKNQAYEEGYKTAEHQYLLEQQQAIDVAINVLNRKNQKNNEIAKAYWQRKASQQPKLKTVEKRIIEYVEINNNDECMLHDDELLILSDLVGITNGNTNAENRPSTITALPKN